MTKLITITGYFKNKAAFLDQSPSGIEVRCDSDGFPLSPKDYAKEREGGRGGGGGGWGGGGGGGVVLLCCFGFGVFFYLFMVYNIESLCIRDSVVV